MKRIWFNCFVGICTASVLGLVLFLSPQPAQAGQDAQAQTGVSATVIYSEPINVRGGPNTARYPVVGRLAPGDVVPALGVSPGREWVQIEFPDAPGGVGWVYANYVAISGGGLQIVEPPPTPTPIATATVNPTFAAAFIFQPTSTKLPTFTPPPPFDLPKYQDELASRPEGLASGIVVASLLLIGIVGMFAASRIKKN